LPFTLEPKYVFTEIPGCTISHLSHLIHLMALAIMSFPCFCGL
jgi:hypothetical protein